MKTSVKFNPAALVLNVLTILVVFNVPLSRFFPNLYYLAVGLLFAFLTTTSLLNAKTRIHEIHWYFVLYGVCLLLLFVIQSISGASPGFSLAIKSLVSLLWIPFFFIFFSSFLKEINRAEMLRWQIWVACVVGILGYVQFFGSTTLYGWLPESKWTTIVENGRIGLRTYSILNSGQVFGLFSIVYAVITIENRNLFRFKLTYLFIVLILFGAALLSGNKSSTVLFMIYVFFKLFTLKTLSARIALFTSLFFLSLIILFPPKLENTQLTGIQSVDRSLGWISNFSDLAGDKSNQDRLNVYAENLTRLNVFTGNGVGSTAPNEESSREILSESYYFKILLEGGLVSFSLFIVFFVKVSSQLYKERKVKILAVLSMILVSMVFVEAFISPAFFGVWGYLIYELNQDTEV